MSAYDAVCFDLDRTLCVSTQDSAAVLERAFDRVGCEPFCTHTELEALVPRVPSAYTDQTFHENLFGLAAAEAGRDDSIATDLTEAYLDAYDPTAVRFRDGAKRILTHAREATEAVGLITNGSPSTQRPKLETLGIADAFDVSVFVDPDAGVPPKPDPTPFERALDGLGTRPERTVHVGDAAYADVAGANAVGMDSAWLPGDATDRRSRDPTHEPTYELSSLASLADVL